ncbi:hypothetical protein O6H91_04G143800 [Diphasiastrum complanatum]|uniref:Uncharacterized protein n=1 Tax=Diphasiastrum complanatum TaxID=34168 RepID=A0ACC2E2K8_DIPCM|nr:hypothetical protein O6H91_04G143800 [Diphasiastrum complanatum]
MVYNLFFLQRLKLLNMVLRRFLKCIVVAAIMIYGAPKVASSYGHPIHSSQQKNIVEGRRLERGEKEYKSREHIVIAPSGSGGVSPSGPSILVSDHLVPTGPDPLHNR